MQVNGIPSTIPAQVSDQLSIRESQNVVSITQTPHLVVTLSPTGEVTVTVTKELSRELCGVCGDYDGDAANDLRGPDGKLVADFLAMTKALSAPDFTPVSGPTEGASVFGEGVGVGWDLG